MLYENISRNIYRIAKKKGISIKQLEDKADVGNGTIGKWGKSKPNIESLEKIANYLGVSVAYLLREPKAENQSQKEKGG